MTCIDFLYHIIASMHGVRLFPCDRGMKNELHSAEAEFSFHRPIEPECSIFSRCLCVKRTFLHCAFSPQMACFKDVWWSFQFWREPKFLVRFWVSIFLFVIMLLNSSVFAALKYLVCCIVAVNSMSIWVLKYYLCHAFILMPIQIILHLHKIE